ncbi:MAG: cell division protein FtsX [Fibrobacterota bacterium]
MMYFFIEAIRGILSNKVLNFSSMVVIAIAVSFISGFYNTSRTLNNMLRKSGADRITIEAFLAPGHNPDIDPDSIARAFSELKGVKKTEYVSSSDAYLEFVMEFGQEMVNAVDTNPFPPSVKLYPENSYYSPESLQVIVSGVYSFAEVESVTHIGKWVDTFLKIRNIFNVFSIVLSLIIISSMFYIVTSTIRQSIHNRREYIKTLQLIGASPGWIKTPFLIEGAVKGAFGGLISVFILNAGVFLIESYIPESSISLSDDLLWIQSAAGLLIGFICSIYAMGSEIQTS